MRVVSCEEVHCEDPLSCVVIHKYLQQLQNKQDSTHSRTLKQLNVFWRIWNSILGLNIFEESIYLLEIRPK